MYGLMMMLSERYGYCILLCLLYAVASATVAPGDESQLCTEILPAAGVLPRPFYPTNIKVLMDSYNYETLLPPQQNPVWQQVDLDNNNDPTITTNWIQLGANTCRGTVFVCGFTAGTQNNWLITQLINRTVNGVHLQQVSVQIEYQLQGCEDTLACQRLFEVYKFETSSVDTTAARETTNYELVASVAPAVDSLNLQNETITIDFTTQNTSFYLAIRDVTSCIAVSRILIFYTVCQSEISDLSIRPETIAPIDSTLLQITTQCVPNANSGGSSQSISVCSQGGIWTTLPGQECTCNQGFVLSNDTQNCIESEALIVTFINNSPRVNGTTITVDIQTNVPIESMFCAITGFPLRDCSSGTISFTDVPPRDNNRLYTLRVIAKTTNGDSVTIRRSLSVEQEGFCSVHLINEGVRVVGSTALVEFTGVGKFDAFNCNLDFGELRIRPCTSPQAFTNLSKGEHRVKITPNPKECGRGRRRPATVKFTV